MNRVLKYFIPHHSNDHKPHLFRDSVVVVLIVSAICVEFIVLSAFTKIHQLGSVLSAIYPNALIELTNTERVSENIGALRVNDLLNKAAQAKAEDMASKGYFAHTSPDGTTPWYWIMQSGYLFNKAGENLAVNFNGSEDVVRAWMNSPLHRDNIMNSGFSEVGIGVATGKYQGRDAVFVAQMFGTPIPEPENISKETKNSLVSALITKKSSTSKPLIASSSAPVRVVVAKTADVAMVVFEKSTSTVASAVLAEKISVPTNTTSAPDPNQFLAFLYSIFLSPNIFLGYAYIIAALFVAFPLILSLIFELRRGHMRHLVFGTALFLVLIILATINQTNLFWATILA